MYENLELLVTELVNFIHQYGLNAICSNDPQSGLIGWLVEDALLGDVWFCIKLNDYRTCIERIEQNDPVYAKLFKKCCMTRPYMIILCDSFKV